jgi:hypothetical protein
MDGALIMSLQTGPALGYATFNGRNGTGSISVPGLKVGDIVTFALLNSTVVTVGGELETIVSIADEIQQVDSANLSTATFTIVITRPTI